MTRIKKRRSGKKRTADRKKAVAGRRGARATIKNDEEKKPVASPKKTTEKAPEIVAAAGKKRSGAARRISAAKNIATAPASEMKKVVAGKSGDTVKPKKGFAPWNKHPGRKKSKAPAAVQRTSKPAQKARKSR